VIPEDRTAAESAAAGMEDAVAVVAPLAAPPAPAFTPAAADPIAAAVPAALPPVRTTSAVEDDDAPAPAAEAEGGEEAAAESPCSVASDCSSIASADFEGVGLGFFGAAAGGAMVFEDSAASPATVEAEARVAAGGRSVFAVDCVPLWGCTSICGRRPEMEDAVAAVPRFFDVPLWMLTGDAAVDGLDPLTFRLPSHFFGVYDGHGGAQASPHLTTALSKIEHCPHKIKVSDCWCFVRPQLNVFARFLCRSQITVESAYMSRWWSTYTGLRGPCVLLSWGESSSRSIGKRPLWIASPEWMMK
jgi:hypothetical protein